MTSVFARRFGSHVCSDTFAQLCFCECPKTFAPLLVNKCPVLLRNAVFLTVPFLWDNPVLGTVPILLHNPVSAAVPISFHSPVFVFSHDSPNTFAQPCFRMTVPIILHFPIVFLSVSVLFSWLLCCDFRYLKNCPASASRPLCVSLLMAVKRSNQFTFVIRHQLSQNIL